MSNLTLEDVAEQDGVLRSTVSRVLNNHPNVSENVWGYVWQIISSTGYHPYAAARSLASARSWMIGLVLPHSVSSFFTDPYFPHLAQGITQACNQFNYTLGLFLISTNEDEEKIFSQALRSDLLDGVIVQSGQIGDQLIERLVHSNIPLVVAGRPFNSRDVSYIDVDNVKAAYQAVCHLIRLGYKRVGTIAGPGNSTVGVGRKEGYLKALAEHGLSMTRSLLAKGDFTEASGYSAMQKLLSAEPDAVFVASDLMAVGAMHAVRNASLTVPDDVAFIGFDDLPIATQLDCPLTTVRQPIAEFGFKAVKTLISLIENRVRSTYRITVETELVVRDSCGASQIMRG